MEPNRSSPEGSALQDSVADLTVAVARTTQAWSIHLVDRLVGDRTRLPAQVAARRVARGVLQAVRDRGHEPEHVIDYVYDTYARLVDLHREFAHRLLDAIDDLDAADAAATSPGRAPSKASSRREGGATVLQLHEDESWGTRATNE